MSTGQKSGELRTQEIEGEFNELPRVGSSFTIFAKPLPESAPGTTTRVVRTSLVTEVTSGSGNFDFFTESGSEYWLSVSSSNVLSN
jgi:hypothetical protein